MTRNACTTNSLRTTRNSVNSRNKKKSLRARINRFFAVSADVLSAAMAWLYAAMYVLAIIAAACMILAGFVVAWDVLIICGDPTSSWGPNSYQTFCIALEVIKWGAIIGASLFAFFGITKVLGVIFKDAHDGAECGTRATVYLVAAIAFMLPTAILRAFLENAEEYFGTLQLVDFLIERI